MNGGEDHRCSGSVAKAGDSVQVLAKTPRLFSPQWFDVILWGRDLRDPSMHSITSLGTHSLHNHGLFPSRLWEHD